MTQEQNDNNRSGRESNRTPFPTASPGNCAGQSAMCGPGRPCDGGMCCSQWGVRIDPILCWFCSPSQIIHVSSSTHLSDFNQLIFYFPQSTVELRKITVDRVAKVIAFPSKSNYRCHSSHCAAPVLLLKMANENTELGY